MCNNDILKAPFHLILLDRQLFQSRNYNMTICSHWQGRLIPFCFLMDWPNLHRFCHHCPATHGSSLLCAAPAGRSRCPSVGVSRHCRICGENPRVPERNQLRTEGDPKKTAWSPCRILKRKWELDWMVWASAKGRRLVAFTDVMVPECWADSSAESSPRCQAWIVDQHQVDVVQTQPCSSYMFYILSANAHPPCWIYLNFSSYQCC